MRLITFLLIGLISACNPAHAGDYQEKPVMCGPEEEIFPILRDKDETLLLAGRQLTSS